MRQSRRSRKTHTGSGASESRQTGRNHVAGARVARCVGAKPSADRCIREYGSAVSTSGNKCVCA